MKMNLIVTLFIAFAPPFILSARAGAAVTLDMPQSAEKFEDIALLEKATLTVDTKIMELSRVAHGLRKKAVFGLVPVRVYVLEMLAGNAAKLQKTDEGALKSLKDAGPILIRITFLRDLPGAKISEAFKEGLESNGIKKLSPELEQVLKEISSIKEFKKNDSFAIAIHWHDKEASLFMQEDKHEIRTVMGPQEFAENFLSIWFGKPSDGRLGDLKKTLIQ